MVIQISNVNQGACVKSKPLYGKEGTLLIAKTMNPGQFGFPQILAGQQTKLRNSIGSKSKYDNYITFQPVHFLHLLLL